MKLLLLSAIVVFTISAHAADPVAGKMKSMSCAACHGQSGISNNPEWPNLAGQQEVYLRNQITAFRDGKRVSPLMSPMVRQLSDEDIANVAAYFATLKP